MTEDTYRVTESCPTWLRLALGEIGISPNFKESELTEEQRLKLQTIEILQEAVEKGLVEPLIVDGVVQYKKLF